jgi:hypothetical protein
LTVATETQGKSARFRASTVNSGLTKRYRLQNALKPGATKLKDRTLTPDRAATLGLKALAFLVGSGPEMERFLDQTGLDTASLHERADEPDFLVSVLDFLLVNEELLMRFCDDASLDVRSVHIARHVLSGAM